MTDNDWKILARYGVTPDNLTVAGSIDLRGRFITALPDNLTVGGYLDVSHTPINALPDNLTVGRWLDVSCTPINALPDNLTVGGYLDVSHTPINALPDNLTVAGSIYLSGTAIKPLYVDEQMYRLDRVGDHYRAYGRRFTAAEAIAHWGSSKYPDKPRGAAFVAAVRAEENRRNAVKES
jgi:hypothetical protein